MNSPKKDPKELEGYYNYYGVPAYVLRQKNGAYASGFYDSIEGVFKAGGSVKKILWDGVRISLNQARRLIEQYSKTHFIRIEEEFETPDWILLPEEASLFIAQSESIREEGTNLLKKLGPPVPDEKKGPEEKKG